MARCSVRPRYAFTDLCVRACFVSQRGNGAVLTACGAGHLEVVKWLVSEGRVKLKRCRNKVCNHSSFVACSAVVRPIDDVPVNLSGWTHGPDRGVSRRSLGAREVAV
jgi:hypothetical protein